MLLEAVPNFSEGRNHETITALQRTVTAIPGALLLDTHTDADHHRTVLTIAGTPNAVSEALFQLIRVAANRIDLRTHTGTHPRVGATDVVPFVPLGDTPMTLCVERAQQLGERVGTELGLPVYLYGAAASRPERQELPALRKGQYEALQHRIATDPGWAPDYGPAQLGPAGAVIIGARLPLIAWNIYLNTANLQIARHVARAVRGSSGGLRGVRALGMLVNGQAQVSMNITDYRTTPLHRAIEMVEREAARYGAMITSSELVGLLPEGALDAAGRAALRLHNVAPDVVLERRIAAVQAQVTSLWHQTAALLIAELRHSQPAHADALATAVNMLFSVAQPSQDTRERVHALLQPLVAIPGLPGALAQSLLIHLPHAE